MNNTDASEEMVYNSLFQGDEQLSHLNACVGNNGQPDIAYYADGFINAALKLGSIVCSDHFGNPVDTFIYPICFNLRHGVELWLKFFLTRLKKIRQDSLLYPQKPGETEMVVTEMDLVRTHDINVFWDWFRYNSEIRDIRFVAINERLDRFIRSIGEIDATGQTFRYPYDTESKKHLTKTPIINIANLTQKISALNTEIKELGSLIELLEHEYLTGTFTKRLSRYQIGQIANQLPDKNSWGTQEFNDKKTELKAQFVIGSCEFSKALNLIQNHYSFAPLIGLEIPLKFITLEDLSFFISSWLIFHSKRESENRDWMSEALDPEIASAKSSAHKKILQEINIEAQAEIAALFYFAIDSQYCEFYERRLQSELSCLKVLDVNDWEFKQYSRDILSKTNFIRHIVISLRILGQFSLLNSLSDKFEVVKEEVSR